MVRNGHCYSEKCINLPPTLIRGCPRKKERKDQIRLLMRRRDAKTTHLTALLIGYYRCARNKKRGREREEREREGGREGDKEERGSEIEFAYQFLLTAGAPL